MFCSVLEFRHAPNCRQPNASTSREPVRDPRRHQRPNTQFHCPHVRTPANQSPLQCEALQQCATAGSRLLPTNLNVSKYDPLKTALRPGNKESLLQAARQTLRKRRFREVLPQGFSSANRTPSVIRQSRVPKMHQMRMTFLKRMWRQLRAAISLPQGDSGRPESEASSMTD